MNPGLTSIAARVVGEPIVPAEGKVTGTDNVTPATGAATTAAEPIAAETTPSSTARENAPKPNKRASLFGGFFGKKDATAPAATETAPAVPAKDEPAAVSTTAPQLDKPVTDPAPAPATENATSGSPTTAGESTTPGATTTPTDKRRSSFFSNLGTKRERKTGTTSGDETIDGENRKQPSGGFGGLLRKASRAQKGNAAPKDAADVPLPKETPTTAEPTEGASETKPAVSESQAGTAGLNETQEPKPVSAAA